MNSHTAPKLECTKLPGSKETPGGVTEIGTHSEYKLGKYEIKVYELAIISLALEYIWVMTDPTSNLHPPTPITQGKFKLSHNMALIQAAKGDIFKRFFDGLQKSIFMDPIIHLIEKMVSQYHNKEFRFARH